MAIILNIDTATENASVCISNGKEILGLIESPDQKNHASFIQPAIEKLAKQCGIVLKDIDAVAVTAGPGSYTGLRVGVSTAKGICYALEKPLIMVSTLEVIAQATISTTTKTLGNETLFCPMIDARRMEVFTAVYNNSLQEISPAHALILEETSFADILEKHTVYFAGSGSNKFKNLLTHPNANFPAVQHSAADLAIRAETAYQSGSFADIAYSEPFYVKEFYTPVAPKSK